MSIFDRFLSLWVALCIVAGVLLGNLIPGFFQTVAGWEYASVNLVVAVLINPLFKLVAIPCEFGVPKMQLTQHCIETLNHVADFIFGLAVNR